MTPAVAGLAAGVLLAGALALAPEAAVAQAPCEDWAARLVWARGSVQVRRAGQAVWGPVTTGAALCLGDSLRVRARSRADVLLRGEALLNLDQNTAVTFSGPPEAPGGWIEFLTGAGHFLSRVTRGLRVLTPFVNGTVEGTEFFVQVADDHAVFTVFEGRLSAENPAGRLVLTSGQSAVARAGAPPVPYLVVRPRDAVQWALHYPTVVTYRPEDFPDAPGVSREAVRRSVEAYRAGDLEAAFGRLDPPPADPRVLAYRATLLLAVGRAEEARADLDRALALDPRHAEALGLRSVIALARNEEEEALARAREAVSADPRSAAARVALSYVLQGRFDLRGAQAEVEEALRLRPDDALAQARLAELRLSQGDVRGALSAAERAVGLDPQLARAHAVLGFARLADLDPGRARESFDRAIAIDPADALARLGLGLALIRRGDLEGGRRQMEIAASLDPNDSLVRSYLGKAYYEERRDRPAAAEFAAAKELDPNDPTPWFYDAIRKQSVNRPVGALRDLQRAIELNDNRAVYRSRLLLDEDLAARSASLARIYDDLGFQQRALVEGWTSVNTDPSNFSAHRFLAEAYAALPRHEVARVSERHQALLLEPLAANPVLPSGAIARPFILTGTGPTAPGFNEFDALFDRNRFSFLAAGVAGGNDTQGDEVAVAGQYRNVFLSAGQFHYDTEGFRSNNDLNADAYNVFGQVRVSRQTSLQAEFRYDDVVKGDLGLRFDPDNFQRNLRQFEEIRSVRVGARHTFTPGADLLVSASYRNAQLDTTALPFFSISTDEEGYAGEAQYLFRSRRLGVIAGGGHYVADGTEVQSFSGFPSRTETTRRHVNLYAYSLLDVLRDLTVTAGVSGDFFEGGVRDRDQVNPKLGLTWSPLAGTTLRAAVLRTFGRPFLNSQTLEPTQVAGFSQYFTDLEATEAWRYGVGIDHRLSSSLFVGAEGSRRTLEIPLAVGATSVELIGWRERLARGYLYWASASWLALAAEYEYERLDREENPLGEAISEARTHRIPLTLGLFGPAGAFARLKVTRVDQEGVFADQSNALFRGEEAFWVADASLGYRLPKRLGVVSIEAKNVFDERFRYQDTDPANPEISPERLLVLRVTLAY